MTGQNTLSQSQKLMISRIVFVLKKSPRANTKNIQKMLVTLNLPSYSLQTLYSCLKELQMDDVVTCNIIKKEKNDPPTLTDIFSLTDNAKERLEQLQIDFSHDRQRKKLGKEYAVIRCSKCKSYRIVHFPFKTTKCFNCGQKCSASNIIMRAKKRSEAISILKNLKSTTAQN